MPSKNTIRNYTENGYYHIYNRGVEKRKIFESTQDYQKFIYYLKIYLSSSSILAQEEPLLKINLVNHNLHGQVEMLAFCLMPTHYHLLVKPANKDAITKLMRQVSTSYSMYFNRKYERVGPLFQGKFKAVAVEGDDHLLHLSRYIHQNPLQRGISLGDYQWSSYLTYIDKTQIPWLNTQIISEYFSNSNPGATYQNFVENQQEDLTKIQHLTLEN